MQTFTPGREQGLHRLRSLRRRWRNAARPAGRLGKTSHFTQRNSDLIQCLALSGSTLYACAPEVNGFIVGASMDDGNTFTTLLHLCSVRGPLACGASTAGGMICPMYWTGGTTEAPVGQGAQLGVPCSAPPDGGPENDAAADAGPPTKARSSSAGCAASRTSATIGCYGLAGLAVLCLALLSRRASRNRSF